MVFVSTPHELQLEVERTEMIWNVQNIQDINTAKMEKVSTLFFNQQLSTCMIMFAKWNIVFMMFI